MFGYIFPFNTFFRSLARYHESNCINSHTLSQSADSYYILYNLILLIPLAAFATPLSRVHNLFLQLGNINYRLPSSTLSLFKSRYSTISDGVDYILFFKIFKDLRTSSSNSSSALLLSDSRYTLQQIIALALDYLQLYLLRLPGQHKN